MKKITFLILLPVTAVIIFIFNPFNQKSQVKNNQKPIIVGFAQLGSESAWRMANTESVKAAAQKYGIGLVFNNAEGSQELQKRMIKDFIIQRVDVIIFPPLLSTGWEDILKEAKAAKIPVIVADRTIEPNDTNLYSVFVGSDFRLEGKRAGKWLVDNTNPNLNVNVVELKGLKDSSPAEQRAKGFREVIASRPNIKIMDSAYGDFIKVKGKFLMKQLLKKHGSKINVVYAHNDDMALGAIEAIQDYGLRPGKDILIVSVDGEKAALEAIKEGKLNVSVECSPLLGPTLMNTAIKLHQGKSLPKTIVTEEKVFTKRNVKTELPLRTY